MMMLLSIIFIIVGLGFVLGAICQFLIDPSWEVLTIGIIGFAILAGSILFGMAAFDNADEQFKYNLQNEKYQTTRTFITGIYKDKIDTKDGEFYTNNYSKFKDLTTLKVDQVVTITYICKEYSSNYIINIKPE